MSDRQRLPGRHDARTIKINYRDLSGLKVKSYATYSTDQHSADQGRVTEVFIVASQPGSAAEAAMRDAGLVLSLALQHGVMLEEVARCLTRNEDGSPAGPVAVVVDAILLDVSKNRGERA